MKKNHDIEILVDYLSFTIGRECFIDSVDDPEDKDETDEGIFNLICTVFGFETLQFMMKRGFNGYDRAYMHEGITICVGNCDTIMLQLSGKGCRLYETISPKLDWLALIHVIQRFRVHNISRLDIACDTFQTLNIDKLITYTLGQRYVSRFVDYFVGQGNKEKSIILGAPSSRFRLRIYDKTLERSRELGSEKDVPIGWVRLEFQLRDASADSFIEAWKSTNDISAAYFGIMANQLRYVKERNEQNPQRSVNTFWWQRFLGNAGKIKMAYKGGLEYNLQSLERYLFCQAGSSIRTWLELCNYDMDQLREMVKHRKLNDRQQNLLQEIEVIKNEM